MFISNLIKSLQLILIKIQTASETLREVPFKFEKFNSTHKNIDTNWLEWFIGFVEGDGGLYKNSQTNRLTFSITQKEPEILQEIHSVLGFGYVNYDISMKCYRYRIQSLEDIYKLSLLFNGNFFQEHRINQLRDWIYQLNQKGYNITHDPSPMWALPSLTDAWLSGFTDAEGCFSTQITKRDSARTGFRISIRFTIAQRDNNSLLFIRQLFGFGSVHEFKTDPGLFSYVNSSFTNTSSLVKYFNLFPLKTKKQLAFVKWCHIREMLLRKEHLK